MSVPNSVVAPTRSRMSASALPGAVRWKRTHHLLVECRALGRSGKDAAIQVHHIHAGGELGHAGKHLQRAALQAENRTDSSTALRIGCRDAGIVERLGHGLGVLDGAAENERLFRSPA